MSEDGVPLKVMKDLEIPPRQGQRERRRDRIGPSAGRDGCDAVGTLLDELKRRDQSTALVRMCIGGGTGISTIIERI